MEVFYQSILIIFLKGTRNSRNT